VAAISGEKGLVLRLWTVMSTLAMPCYALAIHRCWLRPCYLFIHSHILFVYSWFVVLFAESWLDATLRCVGLDQIRAARVQSSFKLHGTGSLSHSQLITSGSQVSAIHSNQPASSISSSSTTLHSSFFLWCLPLVVVKIVHSNFTNC
jgi:hypothetical protein